MPYSEEAISVAERFFSKAAAALHLEGKVAGAMPNPGKNRGQATILPLNEDRKENSATPKDGSETIAPWPVPYFSAKNSIGPAQQAAQAVKIKR